MALAGRDQGRWVVWDNARLTTALWFLYRARRAKAPLVVAMLEALDSVWPVPPVEVSPVLAPKAVPVR